MPARALAGLEKAKNERERILTARAFHHLAVTPAIDKMIIDEPACLHMRIHDRASNELEPSANKVLADRIRFRTRGRYVSQRLVTVDDGLPPRQIPRCICQMSQTLFVLQGIAWHCSRPPKP